MLPTLLASLLLLGGTASAGPAPAPAAPDPRAAAVLDAAIERMGGAAALEGLTRIRREMMTQWQRTSFDSAPYADQPSYEWHSELRDYELRAWRNTRRFMFGGSTWRDITDVVHDTVAIRRSGDQWAPLNVAYVDERRELFAFAPERVLLLARRATDLRLLPDTSIAGRPHARVAATVDTFPATLFIRRGDGLLAMVRWTSDPANDFGLVPWGAMEAEFWYSAWRSIGGVALPTQWDVRRVGRPYRRMTVMHMAIDSVARPDSFAIGDSLRTAYFASAVRPMHDLPLDSARVVDQRFALFNTPGAPAGAVRLGSRWILFEAGQAPLSTERAAAWLAERAPGTRLGGAVLTWAAPAHGGAAWLAARRLPLHVAPGAEPFVARMLRNRGQPPARRPVRTGEWLRIDGDSLRVEPIDLPDMPGALVVYAPSLRWVYSAAAASPLQLEYVLARARERGWVVERVGHARGFVQPAPRVAAQ